ncbi:MAG TPA: hypothetical protein VGI83_02195 [Gemmatimonadales bacterium]|jgi:hypothetical protein
MLAAVITPSAVAQQPRTSVPIQVRSDQPLEGARKRYHDALWTVRDTVSSVRSALEQFQRDPAGVSRETILSRAATLTDRCVAATRTLRGNEPVFDSGKAPERPPRVRAAAERFAKAMRALSAALDSSCRRGFAVSGPGQRADTLRAWAGFRGGEIDRALAGYEQAVGEFTAAAEFRLEPVVPRR